jgi:signal transduction histidine kinase
MRTLLWVAKSRVRTPVAAAVFTSHACEQLSKYTAMSFDVEAGVPVELDDPDTSPVIAKASHILVVDDVPANLVAAEAALEGLARSIVTATSGEEALAHLLSTDFALALLDVNMPGMDGFELARLIRSRERSRNLPIIFITANAQDEASVLRAYELGAVDFLFRPLHPAVLLAKASVFVSLHEQGEQLATERIERQFENRKRDYQTAALKRERDRELEAKQELARLNAALAEHDRRKDSFLAILAHELRNPLAPLQTCLDLVESTPGVPLSPKLLDVLKRQTQVLVRLVDDLLDVSRIKADKIELRPERMDIMDIVEAAILTSRPVINERSHVLLIDAPTTRAFVIADSVRMAQVFCNLLNNAARYTSRGGQINISITFDEHFAIVTVRDNGMGIPPELQDSIFSMFVQERVRSDGSGGLGLGLALSRRLVEMHNGSISVHSEGRGRGSTFEVRVPREGSPLAVPARKRTREMAPLLKEASARVRAIVVDDNDDARELICELLRTRGFDVLEAGDGHTAVAKICEHQPDVAFVDLGLPGLDGIGVAQTLRHECPDLTTRLVALTGYGHDDDFERTRRAGFHAHLVKPASAEKLLGCVQQQLDARRGGGSDVSHSAPDNQIDDMS